MAKYHITPDGPKPCTARFRKCKYGDSSEHYKDQAAAYTAFAEKMQEENGMFKTSKKTEPTQTQDFFFPQKTTVDENGKIHSFEDKPSYDEYGNEMWHKHGLLHRLAGPAFYGTWGEKEYWVEGSKISEEEFNQLIGTKNDKGELHSFDGQPAISRADNVKMWYKDGVIYRDGDKPAVIDGKTEKYYKNGQLHRDGDKPAVVHNDGKYKGWYQNGELHRTNGPAIEETNGNFQYWVNGKLHRVDGPAIHGEWQEEWYQNGVLHRENGAAIEDGSFKKYYLYGKEIEESEYRRIYPDTER